MREVVVGKLIRICPGRRYGWYQSNVGPVRKPLKPEDK